MFQWPAIVSACSLKAGSPAIVEGGAEGRLAVRRQRKASVLEVRSRQTWGPRSTRSGRTGIIFTGRRPRAGRRGMEATVLPEGVSYGLRMQKGTYLDGVH